MAHTPTLTKDYMLGVLEEAGWVHAKCAEIAGVKVGTWYYWAKRYRLPVIAREQIDKKKIDKVVPAIEPIQQLLSGNTARLSIKAVIKAIMNTPGYWSLENVCMALEDVLKDDPRLGEITTKQVKAYIDRYGK